jgi:PIN domain nuclease of toxin-antitoxin system
VRLLVDTNVMLWTLEEPERLGDDTLRTMSDPNTQLLVSSATVWEAYIKHASGKLPLLDDFFDQLAGAGMEELPITFQHARAAGLLPRHHGDPFDRMLVAQAQLEGLTLVTTDARLAAYGVPILPA